MNACALYAAAGIAVAIPLMVPPSQQPVALERINREIPTASSSWQVNFATRSRSFAAASQRVLALPRPLAYTPTIVAPPRRAELWPSDAARLLFQYHQVRPYQYLNQQHQPVVSRLAPSRGAYAVSPLQRGIALQSAAQFPTMGYSGSAFRRRPSVLLRMHWNARRAQVNRTHRSGTQGNRAQEYSPVVVETPSSSQSQPAISTAHTRNAASLTEESKTEQPRQVHACVYCGKSYIQVKRARIPPARIPFCGHFVPCTRV